MDMSGERRIQAPRKKVWDALNDPAVLKASIPGCESLEKLAENELKATAAVKIGPIAARFTGKVQLLDLDPPNAYRIEGEGQGGVAGFAKGGAAVRLTDGEAGVTVLAYDVKAQVGGKLAQLGTRLIDASARQMADAFFDRFAAQLAPEPLAAGAAQPVAPAPGISLLALAPRQPFGVPLVGWVGIVLFVLIVLLVFGSAL
jgi:carbon monoxide dehydrogenase subunit G